MPPKDEGSGGLLSRMVRFVKSPATGWSDLEQDTEQESSYSKQMLKEMIERKRRNDFVRKREFDMLRKMRRSEVMAGQDAAARPSFFQSSLPSRPDDRASTLKKIDEIEAQMSMQWWKTKHGDGGNSRGPTTGFTVSAHVPPEALGSSAADPRSPGAAGGSPAYTGTAPLDLDQASSTAPLNLEPMLEQVLPRPGFAANHAATAPVVSGPQPGEAPAPQAPREMPPLEFTPAAPAQPRAAAAAPHPGPNSEPGPTTGFSPSKLFAIDVDEFAHDPELEEAAIRFANGDDDGAEAGLMEVLSPQGSRVNHDETWLTLFDLFRAIGRQDRFESAAIEFANRFGRSAPQWFSMPEIIGRMSAPARAPAQGPGGASAADWTSPAVFGSQTAVAMNAALARATPPLRLNWSKLTTIADAAIEPLTKTFSQWAAQPVQLRFMGAEVLEQVLRDATPSGDRSINPAWWKLRTEMLRVMHRPDEFELVALDYCVTYEVSPPSWESARCEYKPLQADGSDAAGHTIVGEAFHDSLTSGLTGYGDTQMPTQMSNVATVELAGQVLGDASEALQMLDDRLAGADVMIISCSRLMRIDFTAAGNLLNWVTARHGEGHQVQFVEVHRLVAAFFNVIGISEHARIIVRHD